MEPDFDIVCKTFEDEASANESEEVTEAMWEERYRRFTLRPLADEETRPDSPPDSTRLF